MEPFMVRGSGKYELGMKFAAVQEAVIVVRGRRVTEEAAVVVFSISPPTHQSAFRRRHP